MSKQPNPSALANGQPAIQVKVLRLKPGEKQIIRTLANLYKGLFVHFVKGTGEYCPGREECRLHGIKAVWKGYTPVETWSSMATLWEPAVLEITESLDQDFYKKFAVGQVWQIAKGPKQSKSDQPPVKGIFWEQLDHHVLPAAFDMNPPLLAMYHVDRIELIHDNPMPRRLFIAPSHGAPPKDRVAEQERDKRAGEPPTKEQKDKLRALAKKMGEDMTSK